MKKFTLVYVVILFFSFQNRTQAQCTFNSPFGSATINNTTPGYSVTITTCQWGGEVAVLNFNVTGAFSFSSTNVGDYITITNSTNSVIAFGTTPINASINTTGTYYLHLAASGPPACATQNVCRTTRVYVPFPPCTGTPQPGTPIANPSIVCPNTSATISLVGGSIGTGLIYDWQASTTGSLGPYGLVPGPSAPVFTTPITATTTVWYRAVMVCTNSSQSATSSPVSIDVAGTTTNSVPYFEGFEGLLVNNQLPNCSWKASNVPTTCQTYVGSASNNRVPRTGSKFASFYYLPAASSFFYSNGLFLNSGVTYSAAAWYTTEANTFTNWSDLSLLIGPNQSTVGLQSIVSTSGTAASPNYKSISNTFSVASPGIYYLAIRATSNGSCCAQYLSFDDIEITAPCSVNTPTVSLSASQTTICEGGSAILSANGANTYSWSNGASSPSIQVSPLLTTIYTVVCTNTASGCSASLNQMIQVYPKPVVGIVTPTLRICEGQSLYLNAVGANSYTWNTGFVGSQYLITPASSSSYSVQGANAWCLGEAFVTVTVNPLPVVSAISNNAGIACAEAAIVFTGNGASTYTWISISETHLGNPVTVFLSGTTTFTLIGRNTNGCTNTTTLTQLVDVCADLNSMTHEFTDVKIYPNPGHGAYWLQFDNALNRHILVYDASGRVLLEMSSSEDYVQIDLTPFKAGIYFCRITDSASGITRKVIKE
ncbi:MAG: T9SS type A sorting domain-containing protein [Bacteroidia bacterium]|jgi:hypothetical protein|nr:T9SS type A sorting domain-containing protein [Bacteroidia bacterium]